WLHERRERRFRQPVMQGATRLKYLDRKICALGRVDGAAEAELIDIALEIDDSQNSQQLVQKILGVSSAGLLIVDPIGGGIESGIASAYRLDEGQLPLAALAVIGRGLAQRTMLQSIGQVFAHADGKEIGIR